MSYNSCLRHYSPTSIIIKNNILFFLISSGAFNREKIIFCFFIIFLVAQLTEQNHRLTSELQACLSREEELQTRISQLRDQVCDKVRNVP